MLVFSLERGADIYLQFPACSNKTGTSKVDAISKAQEAQKIFFPTKFLNIFSFRKCRIVPKNVKGGTLWASSTYIVTATAHVKIFEAKIRSNLTWHSNMLQTKDLSKKQIRNQKSPPRETTRREDVEKQTPEHGEVLIFGLWRLHYIGNGNRCSRCSPKDPAASCAVTSASAGKPWSIHSY